jgi:hypothetical protein
MKKILENYLYLLTEDPQMDQMNQEYSTIRNQVKKYQNLYNPQKLASEYPDIKTRPPKVKQILDDYTELVKKFSDISDERTQYSQWRRENPHDTYSRENVKAQAEESARRERGRAEAHARKTQNQNYNYKQYKTYKDDFWKKFEEELNKSKKERDDFERAFKKERFTEKPPISKTSKIASATIIISFLLYQSYIFYKYHLSASGKACNKYSGSYREICILRYKITALKQQKNYLKSNMSKCNKSDDPQKCKIKINKKIQDIDAKINKLKKEGYETFNVNL